MSEITEATPVNEEGAGGQHVRPHGGPKASSLIQTFFLVLGIVFLSMLGVGSTVLTVDVIRNQAEEQAIIGMSGLVPTIVGILAWLALVTLLSRARIVPRHQSVERIALILGTLLGATWVFIANCGPAFDALDLSSAAYALGDRASVPSEFAEWYDYGKIIWGIDPATGAHADFHCYMERFPHQTPFILLLRACQDIAGNKFHTLFQLVNAVSIGITWLLLCRIAYELSGDDRVSLVTLGLCLVFTPLVYYSTFIYGNLIGQALDLGAWFICILCCKEDNSVSKQLLGFALCSLLLAFSTLVKETMQIASIAFAFCVLIYSLHTKRWFYLPFIVLPFLLTSLLLNPFLDKYEAQMGTDLHNAMPKTAWVVMGIGGGSERLAELGDGTLPKNDTEWPGYFDSYIWGDPRAEGFSSWDDFNAHYLQARLNRFAKNPAYTVKFFGRKLAIEWLEPSCECFLISNHVINPGQFASYMADVSREYTTFAPLFYYGIANTISVTLADIFQSLAAIGSLLWCLGAMKRRDENLSIQLLAIILVLGGALLYLFWETKTQYILPFWLFLIPYSACGWTSLGQRIASHFKADERP